MTKNWQLQEAKNSFSAVVEQAIKHGYQVVTRHGEPAVVIMSMEDFRKLRPQKKSLVDFLAASPLRQLKELPPRTKDKPRRVRL